MWICDVCIHKCVYKHLLKSYDLCVHACVYVCVCIKSQCVAMPQGM